MSKELLVKDLLILTLSAKHLSTSEIETKINDVLSNYSVTKINTTLPSTGDGSTTRYLMEKFMKDKLANGISKGSLKQYFLAVQKLYEFTKKEVTLATKDDIVNYLNYYRFSSSGKELKPNTVKNRYLQLSAFFSWLYVNKFIAENPFSSIQTPKGTIPKKDIITSREMEKIAISCENKKTGLKRARDLAIVSFLYDTGMRASEFCNTRICDIDWNKNKVKINRGKGNKSRYTYFGDRTKERLMDYLRYRDYSETDYLFTHYYRNQHLSVSGIEGIIRNIGKTEDIPRIHPHLFRTSFATNMITKGVSPNVAKHVLGHSNLQTLESYVELSECEIEKHISCIY